MIYKAIGSLLLLLAGGYVTITVRRFEYRRLRVLDGYLSLLYYVKGQIDCYAMPIRDILTRADPCVLAACLGLGREETGALGGCDSLPAMLRESRLYLEPEAERLLSTFTAELGSVYRAEQVVRCDYYIAALTQERRKLCDALPARLRITSTLCLCCALGAAVLLW